MNPNLTWYMAYTKPNCERKIARYLTQKGFTAFCPSCSVSQSEQHMARYRQKILFPTWVFVCCIPEQLNEIRRINGVSGIMFWKDKPAVISDEEISTIRYVVSRFEEVQVIKTKNRTVTTIDMEAGNRSVFSLPSLGYSLAGRGALTHLQVSPTRFETPTFSKLPAIQRYNGSIRSLLNRLPYLLGRKVAELPSSFSGELKQQ